MSRKSHFFSRFIVAGPTISVITLGILAASNALAFPDIKLQERVNGERAIQALGESLPAVAAEYGMSPNAFAKMLRTDTSAWIDRRGRLFYIEPPQETATPESGPVSQTAPFPLQDTFTLNSRPGAPRVIYLDFNGHSISGTAWNVGTLDPIISPPYSQDSDPNFSDKELADIQLMWRQVAEDYAPFDVNVTTQDPGEAAILRSSSSDLNYGSRVVITNNNFYNCNCGGVAYVGVFDRIGDAYYQPAFVFNTSLVGAGEAISHEVGHNGGLNHDGTASIGYYEGHGSGATGWAPIMGVGYYQQLVQWSKGEYSGANNTQDDIATMQTKGLPLMVDDHADSATGATPLQLTPTGTNATVEGSGLIRQDNDIDVFKFVAGAGPFNLTINPAPFSPNLDIHAQLLDSNGLLVLASNPVDSLPAALSGQLAGGEYTLWIRGTGKGDPLNTGYSNYGSLGRYTISGTITDGSGLLPPVAVIAAEWTTPAFAPLYVALDGSSSYDGDTAEGGYLVNWLWNFGDGTSLTSSDPFANHIYDTPGTYTVTLTVIDNDGFSGSDNTLVTVDNQRPVASLSADNFEGIAPMSVTFDGSASIDPDLNDSLQNWQWNFGDGTSVSGNQTSVTHTYTNSGSYTATLTVSDNFGGSDTTGITINVSPPAFLTTHASSEILGAGTISGTLSDTFDVDGNKETITERESGGRRTSRYSYLDHTWVFNLPNGDSHSLVIAATQTVSSDGDTMQFSYAFNGGSFIDITGLDLNSASPQTLALPFNTGGELRLRVRDSDQTFGNLALDSIDVDVLYVLTSNNTNSTPPQPPEVYNAMALSSSAIQIDWYDVSDDEGGFSIERSLTGIDGWNEVGSVPLNTTTFVDTGLQAETTYYYRVSAYNNAGSAVGSGTVFATTEVAPAVSLNASGYKIKGIQHTALSWTGLESSGADIYRDSTNTPIANNVSGSNYDDNLTIKGANSYEYRVCEAGNTDNCSDWITVIF